jgi:integrase/recombinase XerD
VSPHTIAGRVRALKRLFNWLSEQGVTCENPAERIKTPRLKPKEPKGISRDDFLAILATTEPGGVADVRDRAILVFLLDTGCGMMGGGKGKTSTTAAAASMRSAR